MEEKRFLLFAMRRCLTHSRLLNLTQMASVMEVEKWKHQDDQHSLSSTKGRRSPTSHLHAESKEGSDSVDGSHGATLLCPICIHDIEPGEEIVNLQGTCRHRFHSTCLFQWLATQNRDCPYCRCTILTQDMMNRAHQHRREVLLKTRKSNVSSKVFESPQIENQEPNSTATGDEVRNHEETEEADIENQAETE